MDILLRAIVWIFFTALQGILLVIFYIPRMILEQLSWLIFKRKIPTIIRSKAIDNPKKYTYVEHKL